MSSNVTMKIRLGPLVSLDISGNNCAEIISALEGYQQLNLKVDDMCSDLSKRVYPDGETGEKSHMQRGEDGL